MTVDLKTSIVRVVRPDGTTIGTGFVVTDDGLIVTCAHVVKAIGVGPGDTVRVVFHATGEEQDALVEPAWWRDPDAEDMAILRLEGDLPPVAHPLSLGSSVGSKGHAFETFGFPDANPEGGLAGDGEILDEEITLQGVRVLQLRSQEVAQGMSGAPVWDVDAGCVVGMVTKTYHPDATGKFRDTAFATPTDVLVEVCPEVERVLQAPVAPLGKLSAVPDLPPHFLPRPEYLDLLKATVLAGVEEGRPVVVTGAARKVGVQGMGGIGKSVMAAALARDEEVQRAFPDGVVWLILGQQPNIIARQSQLVRALTGRGEVFQDDQEGKACLEELLAGKACLVILDDAWQLHHATAFDVFGWDGRSCLLITTRDAGLIHDLGAREHCLDVLTDEQALTLLAEWSGQPADELPPEARDVAQECGNLPLALAMIGAMVQRKPDRWESTLHRLRTADLDKIQQEFPDYPYPDLMRAIQVGVEALETEVQVRYLDFAVFPEDTPIPEAVLQTFWAPEGLDEYDVADVVDMLVDHSLARRDEASCLSLHDLQFDYVRKQVDDLPALHDRLLRAYTARCQQSADGGAIGVAQWPSGPDDGYFFQHLTYHLKADGRQDELHVLLTGTPDWMERKFVVCTGDTAYVADLELALADFADPLMPIQLQALVALHAARRVVHQRVSRYTDADLEILVWLGCRDKALAHARLRADARRRFSGLLAIYRTLQERDEPDPALLTEADEMIHTILDDRKQATALRDLAAAFAQVRRFEEACAAADAIGDDEEQAWALGKIAAALAQAGRFVEARKMTGDIQGLVQQVSALSALGAALVRAGREEEADPVFTEAQETAAAIWDDEDRASALYGLVVALVQAERLDQAQRVAHTITNYEVLVDAQGVLAAALVQTGRGAKVCDLFDVARTLADDMWDDDDRETALSALAAALARAGRFDEAQQTAAAVGRGFEQAVALSALVAALAQAERFEEAWETVSTIRDEKSRANALHALAKALAQAGRVTEASAALEEALEAVSPQRDDEKRIIVMATLATALTQAGYEEIAGAIFAAAKEAAGAILNSERQVDVLCELAVMLARVGRDGEADELFARVSGQVQNWVDALCPLALAMAQAGRNREADAVLVKAGKIAHGTQPDGIRVSNLCTLATTLVQTGRDEGAEQVLTEAKKMLRVVKDHEVSVYELGLLARTLARAGRLDDAVEIADIIRDAAEQAVAWSALATTLARSGDTEKASVVLTQAWETADAIPLAQEPEARARALREVAVALVETGRDGEASEVFAQACEAASAVGPTWPRANALGGLVTALAQTGRFDEASEAADAIQDVGVRTAALRDLGAALARVGRFAQAFVALGPCESDSFLHALSQWAPSFEQAEPGLTVAILKEAVRVAAWVRPDWRKIHDILAGQGRDRRKGICRMM